MQNIPQPLNQIQLEILQLLSREMSVDDMLAIKRLIVRYFAQQAINNANQVWDENGWSKSDEERLLHIHERTPYKK